jgi:hypothetical protein
MTNDTTGNIISVNKELSKLYAKYIMIGEFGMNATRNDAEIDRTGEAVAFHNSLWASALTGSFATSLNWWWAEYVKAKNLYPHYKAISNFVRNVKWDSGNISSLKTGPITCPGKKSACAFSNVTIPVTDAWGEKAYREFTVSNNGNLSGGAVNAYLHGALQEEMRIDPIFHVNYPSEGKFLMRVDTVSQGARLIVYLDDKEVLSKEFPAGPGTGPWKRSLYRKDYNIYQCVYDTDAAVLVPAGEHVIKLHNAGADWLRIKNITLTNYTNSNFINARAVGLLVDGQMLFWIYNKGYNLKYIKKGMGPSTIRNASFIITDVPSGLYNIEWWDTFKGKITSTRRITAYKNELKVSLPDFAKDVACKIKK